MRRATKRRGRVHGRRMQPGCTARFPTCFGPPKGGDFNPNPSATRDIRNVGTYAFFSPELAADIQFWVDNPLENYGWFLLGNEQGEQNARRFFSHEGGDDESVPMLMVTYHVIPEASTGGLIVVGFGTAPWLQRRRRLRNLSHAG